MRHKRKCVILSLLIAICISIMMSVNVNATKDNKIRFAWFTDIQSLSFFKVYSYYPYVTLDLIYIRNCDTIRNGYRYKKVDNCREYISRFGENKYKVLY